MHSAKPRGFRLAALFAVPVLLLAQVAHAQSAGEVEFSRGVGFAQTPGQTPRTLGKGMTVKEGDRLTTSDGASAIIKLQDGTRMTVRPNSELVLQQYQFKENAPDNSMLMQLVRGGFRAVTGVIAKNSPNAARVQTSTATIGIRGTDFDARLCKGDCAGESAKVTDAARPNAPLASARIINSQGEIFATDAKGDRRRVVDGGAIYPGDLVETGAGSQAVLAFRDDTRITLGSQTRFRVDNFVFDAKNAGEGRFLASVLRGSVRALTGLIAKANNKNVGFATATATIGIRGTGFDLKCTGPCASEGTGGGGAPGRGTSTSHMGLWELHAALAAQAEAGGTGAGATEASGPGDDEAGQSDPTGEGLTLWTWLGSIEVGGGQTALQVLNAGQGLFIPPSGPVQPIFQQPQMEGPQPNNVQPPPTLFSNDSNVGDGSEGLFVFVRDGHIQIVSAGQVLDLGRGEAGFSGTGGNVGRPNLIPKFMDFDNIPLPTSNNPLLSAILGEQGIKNNQVRCQ